MKRLIITLTLLIGIVHVAFPQSPPTPATTPTVSGPIQLKAGTKAALPATLYKRQPYVATDTKELYVGDSTTGVPYRLCNPMSTLGSLIYGGTGGLATELLGNTSTTRKFLRSTGTGSAATAPAWDTLVAGDIPLGGGFPTGTSAQTIRYNGSGVPTANSFLTNDGSHVGIGVSSPSGNYDFEVTGTSWTGVDIGAMYNSAGGVLLLQRVPIATAANQRLGGIGLGASVPSVLGGGASVLGYSTEAWSSTARGGRLSFLVTPNGTVGSYTEVGRFNQDGKVWLGGGTTVDPTSILQNGGAIATPVAAKSANYSLLATDSTVYVDATSAARTITLPDATTCTGRTYIVQKSDSSANAVTIATTGGQTVGGASTQSITAQYSWAACQSNGTNWLYLGSGSGGGGPPSGSAGGDLSGSYPNPTVAKINGNSVPSGVTTGDVLYGSGSNALSKLAIGSTNQVLTVSSGVPVWAAPSATASLPWVPALTVPVSGDTAWANQDSATLTSETSALYLESPTRTSGNLSLNMRVKSKPAGAWTLTVGFVPNFRGVQFPCAGIVLRNSSNSKVVGFHVLQNNSARALEVVNYDSSTTFGSPAVPFTESYGLTTDLCLLRVVFDGTSTYTFQISAHGSDWLTAYTTSSIYSTPDQVGYFIASRSSSAKAGALFCHWTLTTP